MKKSYIVRKVYMFTVVIKKRPQFY